MIHEDIEIKTLSEKQIRDDNSHFVGDIVLIQIESANSAERDFGYTLYAELGCTGNQFHAGYNYHPGRKCWELGCN